jgi:hypothetical protein
MGSSERFHPRPQTSLIAICRKPIQSELPNAMPGTTVFCRLSSSREHGGCGLPAALGDRIESMRSAAEMSDFGARAGEF